MKKLYLFTIILVFAGLSTLSAQIPAPYNLKAEYEADHHPGIHPGNGYVELEWKMQSSTSPYWFKIYRQGPVDTSFVLLVQGWRGLKYNDYNIQSQSTYSYYVVAYNNSGESSPSNIATVTIPLRADFVRFVTFPPKFANINELYSYDANAVSNIPEAIITYYKVEGPADLEVDSLTGLVTWTPTTGGYFKVKISAVSDRGGKAFQEWTIKVNGPTGILAGVVTNEQTSSPLKDVKVYFLNLNSTRLEKAETNENGEFSKSLPAGEYKVKFYKRGFYPEFYDNKSSIDSADIITVSVNTTTNITAALTPVPPPVLYTISGSVLDSNGIPVKSIVTAFVVHDTIFPIHPPVISPRNMSAVTDSLGNYQIRVLGGFEYVVFAKPFNKNYYPEFYNNKRTFQEADRILVNSDVTDINFIIEQKPVYNNGITGLVKDFNTGDPVQAIVTAFKLQNGRFKKFKSTRTDSLGNYSLENLIPGNYLVFARPTLPYLPGYYKADTVALRWRDADTVIVTENSFLTGIDINLITRPDTGFAVVKGKVYNIFGEPVNTIIYAFDLSGNLVSYTNSSNDGSYSLENMPAGDYTLIIDDPEYENTASNGTITLDYGTNSVLSKDLFVSPSSTTSVRNSTAIPSGFTLSQNYPNPFNPSTTIRFTIPEKAHVVLEVYNLIGQKVATLINDEMNPGQYDVNFTANNLTSGVYLYKIQAGSFSSVKKMILLK